MSSYLADEGSVLSDHQLDLLYDQEDLLNYLNEFADSSLFENDG